MLKWYERNQTRGIRFMPCRCDVCFCCSQTAAADPLLDPCVSFSLLLLVDFTFDFCYIMVIFPMSHLHDSQSLETQETQGFHRADTKVSCLESTKLCVFTFARAFTPCVFFSSPK